MPIEAKGMLFNPPASSEDKYFNFFAPYNWYRIPEYQRNYAWSDYQVDGVIQDIQYMMREGRGVSWANILIQRTSDKQLENENTYEIGDGQQRIVTINLALLALWHVGRDVCTQHHCQDQTTFLSKIMPLDMTPGQSGLLGSVSSPQSVRTRVSFFSESLKKDYEGLFIYPLSGEMGIKVEALSSDKASGASDRLIRNFAIFRDYFRSLIIDQPYEEAIHILEKAYQNISHNVYLTIHLYGRQDNMYRAFSNMNTYGVSLSKSELTKAEIYGAVKAHDTILADEIMEYWTKNLETQFWEELWQSMNNDNTNLDVCLRQAMTALSNFDSDASKLKTKDFWRDEFTHSTDLRKTWRFLKNSIEVFETAKSDAANPSKDTTAWETRYCYQVIGNSGEFTMVLAYMMKLRQVLGYQGDYVDCLHYMIRHFLYTTFRHRKISTRGYERMAKGNSPFRRNAFTVNDFKTFLETYTDTAALRWGSSAELEKAMKEEHYSTKFNAILSELFIFVSNEQWRLKGHDSIDELFNPRELLMSKSREHILPQKPRHELTDMKERALYEHSVGMIGNSLPLPTIANSKLSNRMVEDKISLYEMQADSRVWGNWVREFLQEYNEDKKWSYEQIQKRSEKLAKAFSPYLVSDHPNVINYESDYRHLLNQLEPGKPVEIRTESSIVRFVLMATGELKGVDPDIQGMVFATTNQIREAVGDRVPKKVHKKRIFVQNDEGRWISLADCYDVSDEVEEELNE